jgi:hypothetical protein
MVNLFSKPALINYFAVLVAMIVPNYLQHRVIDWFGFYLRYIPKAMRADPLASTAGTKRVFAAIRTSFTHQLKPHLAKISRLIIRLAV